MLALPLLLATLFAPPLVAGKLPIQYRSKVGRGLIDVGLGNGLSQGRPGDGIAFLTTRDGNVFTIQATTGAVLNRYVPTVEGECTTVVDWNDGNADYGAYAIGNTIILIDQDGNLFSEFTIDQGQVSSQPVVKNDLIYIASNTDSDGIVSVYDPFNTNPSPRVFAQQTLTNAQFGPLTKGPDGIYFGNSNGIVFYIDTSVDKYDPQISILGQSSVGVEDMRGKIYADSDDVVVHTPGGNLYGWNPANGQLKFALALEATSSVSLLAPVKSNRSDAFYVVSGYTTYALSSYGTALWSSKGEIKTKPVVDTGSAVFTVEESGEIQKVDASNGKPLAGSTFTPLCDGASCGTATGYALLTEDGSLLLAIHDSGWLVAVCATCDAITSAPVTFAPITPAPVTPAPVTPAPTTPAPTTPAPTTSAPTTSAPTTSAPTTSAPTTRKPVATVAPTQAPVTASPTPSPVDTTPSPFAAAMQNASGSKSEYVSFMCALVAILAGTVAANVWG